MLKLIPRFAEILPTGYVQSYHLTVQRQLGTATTIEASYVGEHGVKL